MNRFVEARTKMRCTCNQAGRRKESFAMTGARRRGNCRRGAINAHRKKSASSGPLKRAIRRAYLCIRDCKLFYALPVAPLVCLPKGRPSAFAVPAEFLEKRWEREGLRRWENSVGARWKCLTNIRERYGDEMPTS